MCRVLYGVNLYAYARTNDYMENVEPNSSWKVVIVTRQTIAADGRTLGESQRSRWKEKKTIPLM